MLGDGVMALKQCRAALDTLASSLNAPSKSLAVVSF